MRRVARRLVFGFRSATAGIRAPAFWRVLYTTLEAPWLIRLAARASRRAALFAGTTPVELVDRLVPIFETGWPHHLGTPWVNLNVQRFHRRVVREHEGGTPRTQRPPRARSDRLRIGVVGLLEGAFFFTRRFFEARPAGVDLVAFDVGSATTAAEAYVGPIVESYRHFTLAEIEELGEAIDRAGLDIVLVDVRKRHVYDLLDRIEAPCVALLCAEVYLRYHPSVSFHLYPFQQADYFPRDDRLFCGTSGAFFGDEIVFPCFFPYDLRGLDPARRRPWAAREPLIVFHGRLFKASEPFLDLLFALLGRDDELRLVVMGGDSQGALDRIMRSARLAGVAGRVSYEGPLTTAHDEHGGLADPAWRRLFDLLGRARLAPDPWPLAGGATRVEAYAAGAPTAHMGIRTDRASWGRPQHMVTAEHAALLVPRATAYSVEGYAEICRGALYDEEFAELVAGEQAVIAEQVGDPRAFWQLFLDRYERWLAARAR